MAKPLEFRRRIPAFVLAPAYVAVVVVLIGVWFGVTLTPLQGFYFRPYSISLMGGSSRREVPVRWVYKTAPSRQPVLAHDADVASATRSQNHPIPLDLSAEAKAEGWTGLVLTTRAYAVEDYEAILKQQFFAGKTMARLLLTPLCGAGVLILAVFVWQGRAATKSRHEERHGRRTKGPELMPDREWGGSSKEDGIRLRMAPRFGFLPSSFSIPKKLESSHIMLMGDTGSGKSNAIRQILRQVEERGESAVVYDPAGEFVQEFYQPKRGDLILNPLDERCPYWDLAGELYTYGVAEAIAAAMLPEKDREKGFFTDAPRRVLARLLTHHPRFRTF